MLLLDLEANFQTEHNKGLSMSQIIPNLEGSLKASMSEINKMAGKLTVGHRDGSPRWVTLKA